MKNKEKIEQKIENKEIKISENVSSFEKENYKLKLIVLGDTSVGKTNIIQRYISDDYSSNTKSTVGVEFFNKTFHINKDIVKLEIWDTAGQERYKSITSAYYKGSRGVFLVYDITNLSSFEDLDKWKNEINEKVKGPLKMMIIGNKSDLKDEREVSTENALEKAKNLNIPFMETSALESINIKEAFESILKEMYKEFKKEEKIKADLNNRPEGIKLDTKEMILEKEILSKGIECC